MGLDGIVAAILAASLATPPIAGGHSDARDTATNSEIEKLAIDTSLIEDGETLTGTFNYTLEGDLEDGIVIRYKRSSVYVSWPSLPEKINNGDVSISSLSGFGILEITNPREPYISGDHTYFVIKPSFQLRDLLGDTAILDITVKSGGTAILDIAPIISGTMAFLKFRDNNDDGRIVIDNNTAYNLNTGYFEFRNDESWEPTPTITNANIEDAQVRLNRIFIDYAALVNEDTISLYPNDKIGEILKGLMTQKKLEWDISDMYEVGVMEAVHNRVSADTIKDINKRRYHPSAESSASTVPERTWYQSPYFWGGVGAAILSGSLAAFFLTRNNSEPGNGNIESIPIVPNTGVQDGRGH